MKVVNSKHVHEHCYVPHERVRNLLQCHIAEEGLFPTAGASPMQAQIIYKFLDGKIKEKAIFGGSFDLPLLALCEDKTWQQDILGYPIL